MTPAQFKKIDKIKTDLTNIQVAVAQTIAAARQAGDTSVVMEASVEYGALVAALAALETVS